VIEGDIFDREIEWVVVADTAQMLRKAVELAPVGRAEVGGYAWERRKQRRLTTSGIVVKTLWVYFVKRRSK
jgi:hypothetical protein